VNNSVVLATTTFYQNLFDIRATLALKTTTEAVANGFKIVIVDQSTAPIKKALVERDAILFDQEQRGMGAGRRQAIKEAANLAGNDGVVVWIEPEKAPLIPYIEQLAVPIIRNQADLVIPERISMDAYPRMQQYAELLGNQAFYMLTGMALDMWFGPRVFRADLADFFLKYNGEYGDLWDSIFIPVLGIIKTGKRVAGMKVNYIHPLEQTASEDDFPMCEKRITQLTTLVNALKKEAIKLKLYHEVK